MDNNICANVFEWVAHQDNVVEPMQIDINCEEICNTEEDLPKHIVNTIPLELELYALSYCGHGRLQRLAFIADRCPPLRADALRMAISEVMETYNVELYENFHQKLSETLAAEAGANAGPFQLPDIAGGGLASRHRVSVIDPAWIESKTKKRTMKLDRLESDLKSFKCNSIKESIRRGNDDLGNYFVECGQMSKALKYYTRSRNYCTSERNVVEMCINVSKTALYMRNWPLVCTHVSKGEQSLEMMEKKESVEHTILRCAVGIADMCMHRYKAAAKHFLAANLDHCDFNYVITPNNVAMYGGLCALATFDRAELKKCVLQNVQFKLFLELEPQIRDIIVKFYESKYDVCLQLLHGIRDLMYLDLYLSAHFDTLYSLIRNKGMVQYFTPYQAADMNIMAEAFNTNISGLEDELMKLILEGHIQARIDSHNKVLYAMDENERAATFEKAMKMGRNYVRKSRMLILRAAMTEKQITLK